MAWILQGNPNRFDIDDYLARYHFIYWSAPTNQKDFAIGDRVFIWRAGESSGVIAIGRLHELPIQISAVKLPEALGEDLWRTEAIAPSDIKVGVEIEEVRLSCEEGMLERNTLKIHPAIQKSRIITYPQGTVFKLRAEESEALENMWDASPTVESSDATYSAPEGTPQLKTHFRRERSRKLVERKKEQFKKQYGKLFCEVCGLSFEDMYPPSLGSNFIEAHHKVPLSEVEGMVRTTLDDLMMVCSNCHRMIHRTLNSEGNLKLLVEHFAGRI